MFGLLTLLAMFGWRGVSGGWAAGRLFWLGQGLVWVGAAINLIHFAILKRAIGGLQNPVQLVVRGGFFPRVRHPMYLGEIMLAAGFVLLIGQWTAALLGLVYLACMSRLCVFEDRQLREAFPEGFEAWRETSWRLAPGIW